MYSSSVSHAVEAIEVPSDMASVEASSLYAVLSQVADHRGRRGRRYSAGVVLTLLTLAKLAGESTISGIAHWVRLHLACIGQGLPVAAGRLPCANTYSYVCEHIDLNEMNQRLRLFFEQLRASKSAAALAPQPLARGERHLALDGKSLCGSDRLSPQPQAPVHLLNLYDVNGCHLVAQTATAGKGHERRTACQMVQEMNLRGCVVTTDALHTQATWCHAIREQGGDYLLIAKANQRTLYDDIAFTFAHAPMPCWPEQSTHQVEKGHGRHTVRHLRTSVLLNDYLAAKWPDVAQVFQLERTVTRHGKTHTEIVYGFTSLPPEVAPPERLLALIRHHWHIENRLHWRCDVTLAEDDCQVKTGQVPHVLALLNCTILALMDFLDVTNLAAKLRELNAHPAQALALLIHPL
jgi:predicted transposase YbfD/YdcC